MPLKFIGALSIAIFLHYNDHFLTYLYTPNPFLTFQPLSISELAFHLTRDSFAFVELYFLISAILFVEAYRTRITEGMTLRSFLINRIKRIYPVMIITTLYMYLMNLAVLHTTDTLWSCGSTSPLDLLCNILIAGKCIFHGNKTLNAPIWYISILMLCYLIAFGLTKLSKVLKTKPWPWYVPFLVLGLVMRSSYQQYPFWNEDVARGLIAFFTGLLLGDFLHFVDYVRTHPDSDPFTRFKLRFAVVPMAILLLYLGPDVLESQYSVHYTTYMAMIAFPFVIFACYRVKWVGRLCQQKWVQWLGNISFSMYLWNFPIYITLHLMIQLFHIPTSWITTWGFILFNTALHILVAGASYQIETVIRKKIRNSNK